MIHLKKLEILSDYGARPVVIAFSPRATIVHGASDTGKSFLVKLLKFALGGKKPELIDEAKEFSRVRLTWSTHSDAADSIFERRFGKNQIDYWAHGSTSPTLLSTGGGNTILERVSDVLLRTMNAPGWYVIKNENGDTERLSFRDVLHLNVGTEEGMIAESPGLISDGPMTRTKERSLLRCILVGESDPPQVAGANVKEREYSKKQRETINELLNELLDELAGGPSASEARQGLEETRLNIQTLDGTLSPLRREMDIHEEQLSQLRAEFGASEQRRDEILESLARFRLLERQYVGDIGRLEVVGEGIVNLSLEESDTCPYCGQAVPGESVTHGSGVLRQVVGEETNVRRLLSGLISTIKDLEGELSAIVNFLEKLRVDILETTKKAAALHARIAPGWEQLKALHDDAAVLQVVAAKFEQLSSISRFRANIVTVSGQQVPEENLPVVELNSLSRELISVLEAWGIPGAATATMTPDRAEPVLDGKLRSTRGKGYRSILLSAQMIALAQHCLKEGLPHPGFVVLDSPLVTYKSPKADRADGDLIPMEVADAFYTYLDREFLGQSIVLENVAPGVELPRSRVLEFTASSDGRYGLFPN